MGLRAPAVGPNAGGRVSGTQLPASLTVDVDEYQIGAATVSDGIAAAITAAQVAGTRDGAIRFTRGATYTLNANLSIPPGVGLDIDLNGATLRCGTGVQGIVFARTADFDTFQRVQIHDGTIDRNSVAPATNNSVIGNYVSGAWGQRVSFDTIAIRRIKMVNIPVGAPGVLSHQCISLGSRHLGTGETQTNMKNIVVEDCDLQGGNVGVAILGANTGTGTACEVFHDEVHVRRVKWDSGVTPTGGSGASSAGVQIGGGGFGRRCTIDKCYLANSQDVGIEIDGMTYSTVTDTICVDIWGNVFYARNFHAPENSNAQVARWRGCESRAINLNPQVGGATGAAFSISSAITPNPTFGHFSIEGCSSYNAGTAYTGIGQAIYCAGPVSRISINGISYVQDAISYTNASGAQRPTPFYISPTANCIVNARNFAVSLAGAVTVSGGSVQHRLIYISGSSTELDFLFDGVSVDVNVTGVTNTGEFINIGEGATTLRSGTIRRFAYASYGASGDTTPHGINVRGTGSLTISGRLTIEDCDFSKGPGGYSIFFTGAGQNQDKTVIRNTNWKLVGNNAASATQVWGAWPTQSVAASAVNFATATFTSGTGNKYIGATAADLIVANGSGAGVTAIDVSRDGTNYDNVYTQASGAMANAFTCQIDPGDLVKPTFATTQPTMRVRARR